MVRKDLRTDPAVNGGYFQSNQIGFEVVARKQRHATAPTGPLTVGDVATIVQPREDG